ncbi:Isochorismatase hydrolase [Punctularia strigosozonata HHB-11173 SS5]|uniref:Isochorismatase hydrolase n=1 Tax=Punctularia strigosozonata (strain HHB-11173) TaxID=741275 RepID=UPI000441743A|nr:Isochorismatase hydrolase [Punctularia strigosozonata HHB-11173 SS5]EIN06081.1 Isochorismatase hydrolase [Punctularia strigosozonata HHB-11173 SS5]
MNYLQTCKVRSFLAETNSYRFIARRRLDFFLHPNLSTSSAGRAVVQPNIDLVHAFRAAGSKVIWCQWGLSEYDLLTMPPAFLFNFASGGNPNMTMGDEMGMINDNGTEVDMGRKLVPGSWNAQQYGPLWDLAQEGIANGTDVQFPKNRLSCFWGAQTPGNMFLQDNLISTVFITGVNTDQCVFGTFVDAAYKGYDAIFVQDASATSSPEFATEMVIFNANGLGFVANSTQIIDGLSAQSM